MYMRLPPPIATDEQRTHFADLLSRVSGCASACTQSRRSCGRDCEPRVDERPLASI